MQLSSHKGNRAFFLLFVYIYYDSINIVVLYWWCCYTRLPASLHHSPKVPPYLNTFRLQLSLDCPENHLNPCLVSLCSAYKCDHLVFVFSISLYRAFNFFSDYLFHLVYNQAASSVISVPLSLAIIFCSQHRSDDVSAQLCSGFAFHCESKPKILPGLSQPPGIWFSFQVSNHAPHSVPSSNSTLCNLIGLSRVFK